jgi:sigma-70-like protein
MPGLDALPPDQRAVLQLVLRRRRSYDELADVLTMPPDAVRERARAALAALVTPPEGLAGSDRGAIADWLLGQATVPPAAAREGPGRAWAAELRDMLAPLAPGDLPELPPPAADRPATAEPRSSRLGGALLLAGLAVAVLAVVVWLVAGRDDGDHKASAGAPPARSSTGSGTTTPGIRTVGQATLSAPGGGKALGIARLAVQGSAGAFVLAAQGLAARPGSDFGVWLIGGAQRPAFLGTVPGSRLRSGGRLAVQTSVPRAVGSYTTMLVTREPRSARTQAPTQPGTILLSGRLRLTGSVGR